jgi:superoxide dismutase, Fe-Mn family
LRRVASVNLGEDRMAFELPPLPYPKDALEPFMSARTLEFHHGKHHQSYVTTLNQLARGTPRAEQSLEQVVRGTANDLSQTPIFNNAAQAWNHNFFWNCLRPGGGGRPAGDLLQALERGFGNIDKFRGRFKEAADSQFGSGWAWLVLDRNELKVTSTPDAVNPLALSQTPLLAVDVWEHAYYLDYQNRRPDFVQAFLDHLVNWDFVAKNLAQAGR